MAPSKQTIFLLCVHLIEVLISPATVHRWSHISSDGLGSDVCLIHLCPSRLSYHKTIAAGLAVRSPRMRIVAVNFHYLYSASRVLRFIMTAGFLVFTVSSQLSMNFVSIAWLGSLE